MKNQNTLTHWAFLVGAILSVIIGIGAAMHATWASNQWFAVVLVILGLAVGFVNVTAKEVVGFLVAAIALLAFGSGQLTTLDTLIPKLGTLLGSSVQAFAFFVGAAAIVVAVKEAWSIASRK